MALLDMPPELLAHICRFACVDEGTTGRSLSRVSSYVRAVSQPYRYQSLALFGPNAISSFSMHLKDIRDRQEHCVVRSLLITLANPLGTLPWWAQLLDRITQVGFAGSWDGNGMPVKLAVAHAQMRSVSGTIAELISAVAGTLHTLTLLDLPLDITTSAVLFPYLTDLTVTYLKPPLVTTSRMESPRFPTLQRVHMISSAQTDEHFATSWLSLAVYAPCNTVAVVSYLAVVGNIAPFLRVHFAVPVDSDDDVRLSSCKPGSSEHRSATLLSSLLPGIRSVRVQPLGIICRRGLAELGRDLRGDFDAQDTGLVVLPVQVTYTLHEARRDWLDVNIGGDGCWSEPLTASLGG